MRKTFVVLALLESESNAFAWSQEGHRIVCRIAYDLLTPEEQGKVDALTKAYKTPPGTDLQIASYADACIFPDEAGAKSSPPSPRQAKLLKTASNDQERAEAIIFLGHFVGDVHQPLHVSYESDQGGNLIRPVTGGFLSDP